MLFSLSKLQQWSVQCCKWCQYHLLQHFSNLFLNNYFYLTLLLINKFPQHQSKMNKMWIRRVGGVTRDLRKLKYLEWVLLCPHRSRKDRPETEPMSLWWQEQWQITCAMPQDTVMFSMTLELCTLKSFVMWRCFKWCVVPDTAKGCSGLKTK